MPPPYDLESPLGLQLALPPAPSAPPAIPLATTAASKSARYCSSSAGRRALVSAAAQAAHRGEGTFNGSGACQAPEARQPVCGVDGEVEVVPSPPSTQ